MVSEFGVMKGEAVGSVGDSPLGDRPTGDLRPNECADVILLAVAKDNWLA